MKAETQNFSSSFGYNQYLSSRVTAVGEECEFIDRFVGEIERTTANLASYEPISSLIKELEQTFKECSQPGWDGYGGQPISEKSLSDAVHFILACLPPELARKAEVCPEPDGDLALEWIGPVDSSFSLSFSGNSTLYYAGQWGESYSHGKEYFHNAQKVIRFIRDTTG